MPDEPQTPISTKNSIPVSSQEPMLDAPIPPSTSEQVEVPPEALESPTEAEDTIPLKNDNLEISPVEPQSTVPEPTAQTVNPGSNEPVLGTPEPRTAQMAGNEPLAEPETKNYQPESKSQIPTETYKNHTHENLTKAQLTIQEKKRKKLEKIIEALNTKGKITNDEVEKLLHVSDATATRYLSILEKDGKIKQSGRTGQSVSYSRM